MKTERSNHTVPADPTWRVGIIYSDFYKEEMQTMVRSATQTLRESGLPEEGIALYAVPGSFEIPVVGAKLIESGKVDALIGLGIIVEGETRHARLVAGNTVRGMMDLQTRYGMPFACEVLYVPALKLAQKRLHKGATAAQTALRMLALMRDL